MTVTWSTFAGRARRLFRLPDHRPATVIAVVFVAVILGAFGAAVGSQAGARSLADLPSGAALVDLSRRATGVDASPVVSHETSPRTAERVSAALQLDTGWEPARARQRYAAAGWTVSGFTVVDDQATVLDPVTKTYDHLPTRYGRFTAESDGLVVEVSGMFIGDAGDVRVVGWPAGTTAFRVLSATGAALGLLAGWLLAAALARRVRPAHPAHRATVAGLTAATFVVLAVPAVALYGGLVRVLGGSGGDSGGPVSTVHGALLPGPYYSGAPSWLVPALGIAGGLLAVVTVVLAAWSRPAPAGESRSGYWESAASAVEGAFAAARVDPEAARRLLFLSAYPDWTAGSLDRMRGRLIDAGVPADFLVGAQPPEPSPR